MQRGVTVHVGAWRDPLMTAKLFRAQCARNNLSCVSQELVSWEFGPYLLDAFSIFTRSGSPWDRSPRILRNPLFVAEARRMARIYASSSFRRTS